ncbi:MAG: hypothetical protein KDA36_00710 [Planctomycetaceae bacterium]|nr:hypothetical protein [Planctomycetaceae bacterium]
MTKTSVMLMSLPAAIPAGYLTFLLVMVFLGYGGGATVIHQALAGATLGIAALVAAMPVGILLFYQGAHVPKAKKPDLPVAATSLVEAMSHKDDDERTMGGEDIAAMDEVIASSTSQELEVSQEGFDLGGFGESADDFDEISEVAEVEELGDDAFDGIVDEITETDDNLVLSQEALEVSDDSLAIEDEEISDFDDLFGDDEQNA